MKHLATIQSEFLKQARDWDDLSDDEQRRYLKEHPASKRRLTAKPLRNEQLQREPSDEELESEAEKESIMRRLEEGNQPL